MSERTAGKWSARYRAGGERPCSIALAPHRVHNRTPARVAVIKALRGLRFSGPEIAELLSMPISTVSGILKREGLGRLGRLGLEPARRYERSRPGELIHIDVKKLARIERAGHRVSGDRLRYHPRPRRRLGVRPRRRRRRDPARLRGGPSRRTQGHRDRLPAARGRVLRRLGGSPSTACSLTDESQPPVDQRASYLREFDRAPVLTTS